MTTQTSQRSPLLLRLALEFLKDGEWRTLDELAQASGSDRDELMTQLISPASRGRVLIVQESYRRPTILYHRVTSETRTLADQTYPSDVMSLPWDLKRTIARKIDALWKKRLIYEPLPGWIKALIVLEGYLHDMGLSATHPRPEDGLLYPCHWDTDYNCGQLNLAIADEQYAFTITFTGTSRSGHGSDESSAGGLGELGHWFNASPEKTTLVLSHIADCRINTCTMTIESCPSMSWLVAETKRQLRDVATHHEHLLPFIPLEHFDFELLSENRRRGVIGSFLGSTRDATAKASSAIDRIARYKRLTHA